MADSIEYLIKAHELAKESGDTYQEGVANYRLGCAYEKTEDYSKAILVLNFLNTVHVLYMYYTCTVHVLYMYCTCTIHVLYMYGRLVLSQILFVN